MLLWYLCLIFTYSSACLFGAKSHEIVKRNKKSSWANDKKHHIGKSLTRNDILTINEMSDESHFNSTLGNVLVVRVVDTEAHASVGKFIENEMRKLRWTVETHVFNSNTPHGVKTFRNILATLNPTAPRHLVIACHYDSKRTPIGFLGATDSAVPCSMMINLAHTLSNQLQYHRQVDEQLSMKFIFFDGEEALESWSDTDSLYGSRKLAEVMNKIPYPLGNHEGTTELDRIDLFLLLDLIGTSDCNFYNFKSVNEGKWYKAFLDLEQNAVYKSSRSSKILFNNLSTTSSIQDDHVPFLQKGVPILHLISVPFPSVWHKIGDNWDALHYPTIEKMNTLLRAFVVHYLHVDL